MALVCVGWTPLDTDPDVAEIELRIHADVRCLSSVGVTNVFPLFYCCTCFSRARVRQVVRSSRWQHQCSPWAQIADHCSGLPLNCWPLTPVWSRQHQGRWESWKHWLKVHMFSQSSEAQPVSAPSLYIDHRLIRWSLDPAASSLCLGSWWSEKATLCTMSVWYWSTARGRSFFHPKTRTRWSQPADARSLPSPLIHSWETPGLTSVTQSWSCKNTKRKRALAGLCRLVPSHVLQTTSTQEDYAKAKDNE